MDEARQLLQSGRWAELESLMERTTGPEALHMAAALQLARGRPGQALDSIRRSLQMESSFSQRNTLAVCLLSCGHQREAIQLLEELLSEQAEHADLWFNLARAWGQGPSARQALDQALRLRPGWRQAELLLAQLLADQGSVHEALALVRQDLSHPDSALLEARLVFRLGLYRSAALLCLGLLESDPPLRAAQDLLIRSLLAAGEIPADPRIPSALESCLGLAGATSLLPGLWRIWPERENFLLALLLEDQVTDLPLEGWLTQWRRDFRADPRPSPLAEALAAHNFTHEFCMREEPEEVRDLPPDHPAYPLYRPLPAGMPAPALVLERHQREPQRELAWQAQLVGASRADPVTLQYQQNPYPRWRSLGDAGPARPFHQVLGSLFPGVSVGPLEPLRILVAGCGTGRHAMLCARRFAGAQVWAIDVSAPSLAYAMRQAERLGGPPIQWRLADLLRLDQAELPDAFELIESLGVLHHLVDPEAGLRALLSRLTGPGWMRLGLYSRRARQPLEPARRLARSLAGHDLRQIRTHLMDHLEPPDLEFLSGFRDFYSLSGLRDLLLHEREVEFDLSEIAAMLERNGLEFVGFDGLADPVLRRFEATFGRQRLADLECWERFEEQHPGTFVGMYVFWCRRSGQTGSHLAGPSGEFLGPEQAG